IKKADETEGHKPIYIIKEDNALYWYDEDTDEYYKKLDNVKEFVSGYALTYNNELYSWGDKLRMGIGVTETEYVTEPIKIMDDVREIVDVDYGEFVIKTDGSLWAWGVTGHVTAPPDRSSSYAMVGNQLGIGKDVPTIKIDAVFDVCTTAQKILDNVAHVYETNYVKFALTESGELYGWGIKKWNDLLDISPDEATPQLLIDNVFSFETVGNTALATRKDGSLWAWGDNFGNKPTEVLKNVAYVVNARGYSGDFMFALCRNGDLYTIGEYARALSDDLSFAVKISVGIKSIMYGDSDTMTVLTENNELYIIERKSKQFKKMTDVPEGIVWAMADSRYNFQSYRPFLLYVDKNNDLWHVDLTEGGESLGKILTDVKADVREMPEFANIAVYVGVDSVVMDVQPYIKNGRTMVPMRAIFERLGARLSWDDTTKTAIATRGDTQIKITIGENVLYKNGEAIELDATAEITNDRTMVPVRAISEAFGCTVTWDDEMRTVLIVQ
ncbi:MAG: hypothetical protein IJ297_05925, partial [Clostridia bacterium]|nr:hypothetical protein [Clostridia bacterium]